MVRLFAVLVLVGSAAGPAAGFPWPRQVVADAVAPGQAGRLLKQRMADPGAVEAALAGTGDPSVRAFALWQRLAAGPAGSQTKDELARAVGRLEAAVGTEAPQGWVDVLYRNAGAGNTLGWPESARVRDIGGGYWSRSEGLSVGADGFLYLAGPKGPRALLDLRGLGLERQPGAGAGVEHCPVGGGRHVLAFPEVGVPGGYAVRLVDGATRKVLWKAEAWATGVLWSGPGSDQTSFPVVHGRTVTVFTATRGWLAVESFERETGRPTLRFNASGWGEFRVADPPWPTRAK